MTPSPKARTFVQGFERLRLVGYLPTPRDRPTIGWGHTGPEVKIGLVWTREKADAVWEQDVAFFAGGLSKALYGIPTTQGQFDALFSFAYNVGLAETKGSTLFRKHKAADYAGAAAEFPKWNHQAGVVVNGLTKRRAAERALYLS
jgi:GH24 family phage-related lysozyme (muramidase)